jgi:Xaa-Pro aminopeptidase
LTAVKGSARFAAIRRLFIFCVGGATQSQLDAYKQCREWLDAAIDPVRPGVTTDQIASVWPTAGDLGFPSEESCFGLQFGHGIGAGLYESPMISRLHSRQYVRGADVVAAKPPDQESQQVWDVPSVSPAR